ncbi:EF-hand domain-containing protein [Caenispirillum salinarum]|uniref:EF-hand domain-containing protein n=1 Tax=Caenispirillum salinarum TaxID=859058 RepID=UPI00384F5662
MKTFGKTLMIATAAVTLAAAAPALAQGMDSGSDGVPPRFAAADTDNDGAVSRAEADAMHAERFQKADADGDGTITAQEMQAARAEMRAEMMEQRGGMGRHGGMQGGQHGMHGAMHGGMHGGYGKHGGGHGMKNMHGGGTAKLQRLLEVMDTDGSGAVSQEELLARFKDLDANNDGAVTVAEARDGMRATMRDARSGAGNSDEAAQ